MSTLCERCHLRLDCTDLCETAEKYVSQDNISRIESIPHVPIGVKIQLPFPEHNKSNKQLIAELFFIDRKKIKDITKMLNVSQPYISKIIKETRERAGV